MNTFLKIRWSLLLILLIVKKEGAENGKEKELRVSSYSFHSLLASNIMHALNWPTPWDTGETAGCKTMGVKNGEKRTGKEFQCVSFRWQDYSKIELNFMIEEKTWNPFQMIILDSFFAETFIG